MTDRLNALTVALDKDIRDDDAEKIVNAIMQIKGVKNVTGNVVDADSFAAESRVKGKLAEALYEFIENIHKQ